MNCEEVQRLMKLFVNQDLPEEEVDRIKNHISNCTNCLALKEQTEWVFNTIKGLIKELRPSTGLKERIIQNVRRQVIRRRWFIAIRAAAAVLLVTMGLYLVSHLLQTPRIKVTTALQLETRVLQDGSALVLAKQTEVEVKEPRHLRLHKGQLYLDVKKDRETFKVETELGTIKVLGTEFFIDFENAGEMSSKKRGMIVWVVAGVIGFSNPFGSLEVKEGQILCAQSQEAPKIVPEQEVSQEIQDQKDQMRIAKLIRELQDPDAAIRKEAIWGLVDVGEKAEKSLNKLKGSQDKQVASCASMALKILGVKKQLPERLWKVMPEIIEEIALAPDYKGRTVALRKLLPVRKDQKQYDMTGKEAASILEVIKGKKKGNPIYLFMGTRARGVKWVGRYAIELLKHKRDLAKRRLAFEILEKLDQDVKIGIRQDLVKPLLGTLGKHLKVKGKGKGYIDCPCLSAIKILRGLGVKEMIESGTLAEKELIDLLVEKVIHKRIDRGKPFLYKHLKATKAAIGLLTHLGSKRALEEIKELLDEKGLQRITLAQLIRTAPEEAVEYIEEVAEEGNLGYQVLYLLERLNPKTAGDDVVNRAAECIIQWLAESEISSANFYQFESLASILQKLAPARMVEYFSELLDSENDTAFMVGAYVMSKRRLWVRLEEKKREEIIERLVDMVEEIEIEDLQRRPGRRYLYLIGILGRLDKKEAIKLLREAFGQLEGVEEYAMSLRAQIAKKLGDLGAKDAVKDLIEALDDEPWDVPPACLGALLKLGAADRAIKEIKAMLTYENVGAQERAIDALARLGVREAIGDIRKLLKKERLCKPAIKALAKLGAKEAIEDIEKLLDTCPGEVVDAMVRLGAKERVKDKIIKSLQKAEEKSHHTVHMLIKQLKKLGAKGDVDERLVTSVVDAVSHGTSHSRKGTKRFFLFGGLQVNIITDLFDLWEAKKEAKIGVLKRLMQKNKDISDRHLSSYHCLLDMIERLKLEER